MLLRYAAGSRAGSGGCDTGISGIDVGNPLPDFKGSGDLREALDVRALLAETNESLSSLSLEMDGFCSLRRKRPILEKVPATITIVVNEEKRGLGGRGSNSNWKLGRGLSE